MVAPTRFNGKVCVVTGAGSGMGREVALAFGREGARLALLEKRRPAAETVAGELAQMGAEALVVEVDVSLSAQVQAAFDEVINRFGNFDVVVNCAGILVAHTLCEISEEEWDRVIDINLKGIFLCTQMAVTYLLQHQHGGRIINIGSVAGKRGGGMFGGAHYAASKGGVIAFTKSVAREVASAGICVNTVCPGPTETPMTQPVPQDVKERTVKMIPKGRWGTPADVANAVLFLADERSEYIHGIALDVDGGMTMC